MIEGKNRIIEVLSKFTGRDGEPDSDAETYTLKAMWLMMLSEFEASVKTKTESYIDEIKRKDISDIHICLLTRNFFGDKQDELTLTKIVSLYKKSPDDIAYRHFTQDKVPKYKAQAIEKLFNNLGIFFDEDELISLSLLNSIASTRDSIAHGDFGVAITRREIEEKLQNLEDILRLLEGKFRLNIR